MGDWTSDAPGVRRKITVDDLPPPSSNILAINPPRVVPRPGGAELQGGIAETAYHARHDAAVTPRGAFLILARESTRERRRGERERVCSVKHVQKSLEKESMNMTCIRVCLLAIRRRRLIARIFELAAADRSP